MHDIRRFQLEPSHSAVERRNATPYGYRHTLDRSERPPAEGTAYVRALKAEIARREAGYGSLENGESIERAQAAAKLHALCVTRFDRECAQDEAREIMLRRLRANRYATEDGAIDDERALRDEIEDELQDARDERDWREGRS